MSRLFPIKIILFLCLLIVFYSILYNSTQKISYNIHDKYFTNNSIIHFKQTVSVPESISINKIKNFMNNKNVTKKIIVIKNVAGYGNQLYSIVTSFVIAMLSERRLKIKWDEIRPYIEEPFENTFINII